MSVLRPFRSAAVATAVAALVVSVAATVVAQTPPRQKRGVVGEFDYYILALIWAPEACARQGAKADPARCAGPDRAGFLVAGLWPEYEKGGRPEHCVGLADAPVVSEEMLEAIRPIMAGDGAIQQQWRRYGVCSGLSVDYYFADLRVAWERIKLPEMFKKPQGAFSLPAIEAVHRIADANPDLPENSIAGVCDKKRLIEVRVCLNKDLEPRTCGPKVVANCRDTDLLAAR